MKNIYLFIAYKFIYMSLICCFVFFGSTEKTIAQHKENHRLSKINYKDGVGLNFIRPDVNRPGNYTFIHESDWLLDQYKKLGVNGQGLHLAGISFNRRKENLIGRFMTKLLINVTAMA